MKKPPKKYTSQVNSQKRKKDFLKWMFGCTSNAMRLSLKHHGVDLDSPEQVMEYILVRSKIISKDKKSIK